MGQTIVATLTSPLGLTAIMISLGIAFLGVSLLGFGEPTRDRLQRIETLSAGGSARAPAEAKALVKHKEPKALHKRLERFRHALEPKTADEQNAARLYMLQAGYFNEYAIQYFHAAKFVLALFGLLLGIVLMLSAGSETSLVVRGVQIVGPTLIGYYLPIFWVNRRRAERLEDIARGFPDALDLLLVCVEAGQSIDQAIARVARELRKGYPTLAEEFETVVHELKAGRDRQSVLRAFGERSGNPDIQSFASVLIQSATFGTSTADALRVYAAEMRDKRMMLAEEKANVLPTKLTLGTMLFTVPPLLIILVGPSIYGVLKFLASFSP